MREVFVELLRHTLYLLSAILPVLLIWLAVRFCCSFLFGKAVRPQQELICAALVCQVTGLLASAVNFVSFSDLQRRIFATELGRLHLFPEIFLNQRDVGNVLFVWAMTQLGPFFLFAILFCFSSSKAAAAWRTLLAAACLSITIEFLQWLCATGACRISDFLLSIAGAALGYGFFLLLQRSGGTEKKREMTDRLTGE